MERIEGDDMKSRDTVCEILRSLPQDGTPIRFSDLRKKVKMSSATLSKGLCLLSEMGLVIRKRVHSEKGIGIEYSMDFGLVDFYSNIENKCKSLDLIRSITDKLVLDLFKHYDDAEEDQKEIIFDGHLSVITRFLRLCKTLRGTGS